MDNNTTRKRKTTKINKVMKTKVNTTLKQTKESGKFFKEIVKTTPMSLTFHSPETQIPNKKRATVVGIVSNDLSKIDIGVAVCSIQDTFRKKMGKTIAEGRAQKDRSRFCSIAIKDKTKVKETFYDFAAKLSNAL